MKYIPTNQIEQEYKEQGYSCIAGLDEAGKGSWAGPVVSAAVILPDGYELSRLNDSKQVTKKVRDELYDQITTDALAWAAGVVDPYVVDELGLSEAHLRSMREAVKGLSLQPDFLLVDGMGISNLGVESTCIVKGDSKVTCIAAASIIAKVTRDRLMVEYEEKYPGYGFADHKGYGTKQHQNALEELGVSPIHRLSYKPVFKVWQGVMF